jgi:hypothetical protein
MHPLGVALAALIMAAGLRPIVCAVENYRQAAQMRRSARRAAHDLAMLSTVDAEIEMYGHVVSGSVKSWARDHGIPTRRQRSAKHA